MDILSFFSGLSLHYDVNQYRLSSRGGLVVKRWSDNRLDSARVDQISLEMKVSMVPWPLTMLTRSMDPLYTWKLLSVAQQTICNMYCVR